MGLRFFNEPKLIDSNVPRNPFTGLVIDYAYNNILDKGLPDIRLQITNSHSEGSFINLRSLATENIILVFQPRILTPGLQVPGTPGDENEAIQFNKWSATFRYLNHSVYLVSHLPAEVLHKTAIEMNLTELNFISDPNFMFGKDWHLPIAKLSDGTSFYERVTAVIPRHCGVAKVFSGITEPHENAENVMKYIIAKFEAEQSMLNQNKSRPMAR